MRRTNSSCGVYSTAEICPKSIPALPGSSSLAFCAHWSDSYYGLVTTKVSCTVDAQYRGSNHLTPLAITRGTKTIIKTGETQQNG